eukprot:7305467-Pyramimonas_sp.AAC.1
MNLKVDLRVNARVTAVAAGPSEYQEGFPKPRRRSIHSAAQKNPPDNSPCTPPRARPRQQQSAVCYLTSFGTVGAGWSPIGAL